MEGEILLTIVFFASGQYLLNFSFLWGSRIYLFFSFRKYDFQDIFGAFPLDLCGEKNLRGLGHVYQYPSPARFPKEVHVRACGNPGAPRSPTHYKLCTVRTAPLASAPNSTSDYWTQQQHNTWVRTQK